MPFVSWSIIGHLDSPHSQNHRELTSHSPSYPEKTQTFQMALADFQIKFLTFSLSSSLYKFCVQSHILGTHGILH